jgi:hypothetical protein
LNHARPSPTQAGRLQAVNESLNQVAEVVQSWTDNAFLVPAMRAA